LNRLGFPAERKGRNDITVSGKKISGSAFKQTPNRLVHHGTILVGTDMTGLGKYLTPSRRKLESKGIKSVTARVMNLSDVNPKMDHDTVCEGLNWGFHNHHGGERDIMRIIDNEIQECKVFNHHHRLLRDWNWRYGTTPEFSHYIETRIDGIGQFDIHLNIVNCKIHKIKIFSDCLLPELVDRISDGLIGCDYSKWGVSRKLKELRSNLTDEKSLEVLDAFEEWLVTEI
jgi:lipoate-protein ligase A